MGGTLVTGNRRRSVGVRALSASLPTVSALLPHITTTNHLHILSEDYPARELLYLLRCLIVAHTMKHPSDVSEGCPIINVLCSVDCLVFLYCERGEKCYI